MKHRLFIVLLALSAMACGCGGATQKRGGNRQLPTNQSGVSYYTFDIVAELPHSTKSYTQGFEFADGLFWEGTGGNGSSRLQVVNPLTGEATKSISLASKYFGEGITLLGDEVFQLTWREGKAFVYDRQTLRKVREFDYQGEGWGLTTDGKVLYMSDGSDRITLRDPKTFRSLGEIKVTLGGHKVLNINELEWIGGEIWANIYLTTDIIRIDPATGKVVGIIDLSTLQSPADVSYTTDVLNGIAHDPATGRIWLTGKNWNKVYQVEIIKK